MRQKNPPDAFIDNFNNVWNNNLNLRNYEVQSLLTMEITHRS